MSEKNNAGARYEAAAHAMQTGVKMEMELSPATSATDPKHLRVGVNSAMADNAAIAALLIAKGIFTKEELAESLATEMEKEAQRYQVLVSKLVGANVTLG